MNQEVLTRHQLSQCLDLGLLVFSLDHDQGIPSLLSPPYLVPHHILHAMILHFHSSLGNALNPAPSLYLLPYFLHAKNGMIFYELIIELSMCSVVKNPPANAGDIGLITGLRRSHMPVDQLNPCTTTTEPAHLEPVLHKPLL